MLFYSTGWLKYGRIKAVDEESMKTSPGRLRQSPAAKTRHNTN